MSTQENIVSLIYKLETYGFECAGCSLHWREDWRQLRELVQAQPQPAHELDEQFRSDLQYDIGGTEAGAQALWERMLEWRDATRPVQAQPVASDEAREEAPPNNLPDWNECSLRVENSKFLAERQASGGYGAEHDSKTASALHQFIYEYDDSDPYRSGWFLHRLELVLNEAALAATQPAAAPAAPNSPEFEGIGQAAPVAAQGEREDDGPDLTGIDIPLGDRLGNPYEQVCAAWHREPCGDTLAAIGSAILALRPIYDAPLDDALLILQKANEFLTVPAEEAVWAGDIEGIEQFAQFWKTRGAALAAQVQPVALQASTEPATVKPWPERVVPGISRVQARDQEILALRRALAAAPSPQPAIQAGEDARDAARYRFVKTMTKETLLFWRGVYGYDDAAIDAAMAEQDAPQQADGGGA